MYLRRWLCFYCLYLFQLSTDTLHISIEVFDENGIGGGASGVSGGLLHPYTPKGSPLMEFYSC